MAKSGTTGNHNAHTSDDGQSPFWQLVRKRFHSEKPLLLFKLETDLICHIFGSFDQTFLYLTSIMNTRDTKDNCLVTCVVNNNLGLEIALE